MYRFIFNRNFLIQVVQAKAILVFSTKLLDCKADRCKLHCNILVHDVKLTAKGKLDGATGETYSSFQFSVSTSRPHGSVFRARVF